MSDEQDHGVITEQPKNLAVSAPKRAPTLYFIVAVKFIKGIAALSLAVGVFKLSDNNLPDDFQRLLEFLHIDPEKRFFQDIADRLSDVTASNLHSVALISTFYGLFMLLQAIGLACRVSWAVWLVIIESGFFIPIEILDLVHRHQAVTPSDHLHHLPKIGVAIVLALNIAIVWYLYKNRERIIRHHRHH